MSLVKKAPQQGAFILGLVVFQDLSRHQALGLTDAVGPAKGIHRGVALAGDRLEGLTLLHLVVARSLRIGSLGGCNSEVGILIITADTALAAGFSDINNVLTSKASLTVQGGKKYNLILVLGLTSVKLDVDSIVDWPNTYQQTVEVDLPKND